MSSPSAVALVTGGGSGIGAAIARVLAQNGLQVTVTGRRLPELEQTAAQVPGKIEARAADVANRDEVERLVSDLVATHGRIDVLVNCAGMNTVKRTIGNISAEDWERVLRVNASGAFHCIQCVLPQMRLQQRGTIVNISSVSGRQATPFLGPYAASKFGLEGLSEALRQEMMVFGIDVVVVAPGMVSTPIWDKAEALDVEPYATTAFAAPIENVRFMAVKQGKAGLPAEKIAQVIRRAVAARYPKPRYEVSRGGMGKLVLSLLPRRTVERLTANAIGLKRIRN